MTTANKITILRILLVPLFVVELLYYMNGQGEAYRWWAVLTFALAAVSDGVDGYIARRFQQRSELGAILDPLADKLLIVSGIVLLGFQREEYLARLPLYLTVTVISRDMLLLLGVLVLRYVGLTLRARPHWTGKVATVLQMSCVLWALLKIEEGMGGWFLPRLSLAAALFTAVSGLIYVLAGVRQLAAHPSSLPSPGTTNPPPSGRGRV